MNASLHRLNTGRVRLLVRHVRSGTFVRNVIVSRGLRDAILQAHSVTQDGTFAAFIAINEVVRGFYVRGVREECKPMQLPLGLRSLPMTAKRAETRFLPGLELAAHERLERRIA